MSFTTACLLVVIAALVWFALTLAGILASRVTDAYQQGRRDAIQEAQRVIRERGQLAIDLAPNGELRWGLIRAQMADQLVLVVGDLVKKS